MIEILLPTFILIVALVAIHTLFGIEVIQRGIIFTDLAIGQSAAVGTAVALLWFGEAFIYPISLTFAIGAGLWISFLSQKKYSEASIGLIYSFSFSLIFLIMSHSAEGVEIFINLTAADIIFTPLTSIAISIGLYTIIAMLFIFVLQKMHLGIRRDMLFFTLFAITVSNSVQVAGVMVVFSLLIAPSFIAVVLHRGFLTAFIVGVSLGLFAVIASYMLDLSTGHFLVAIFSVSALLAISFQKQEKV
jgi:zinc/manganese transport system permease protein